MATKLKIEITSYALSTLLGDNANCDGDQEGFLFGEIFTKEGRSITDHDEVGSTKATVIRITSHMAMFEPCEFYNAAGSIDPESMKQTLGPFMKDVVGYFEFKREIPPDIGTQPSLRMSLMFRNLFQNLCSQSDRPLTLLVLRQNRISRGTIGNNYCFYQMDSQNSDLNRFVKVASEIPNLGDTSQRQYTHSPPSQEVDSVIQAFLRRTNLLPDDMAEVTAHNKLMAEIKKTAEEVAQAETQSQEIESSLRQTLIRSREIGDSLAEVLKSKEQLDRKASPDMFSDSDNDSKVPESASDPSSVAPTSKAPVKAVVIPSQESPESKIKTESSKDASTVPDDQVPYRERRYVPLRGRNKLKKAE